MWTPFPPQAGPSIPPAETKDFIVRQANGQLSVVGGQSINGSDPLHDKLKQMYPYATEESLQAIKQGRGMQGLVAQGPQSGQSQGQAGGGGGSMNFSIGAPKPLQRGKTMHLIG